MFTVFLAFDWLRSLAIFAVYVGNYRSDLYAWVFAWTEPLDMILLALAALEAAGAAAMGWGFAVALMAGSVITFPDSDLPLRTQFLSRALVACAGAVALTLRCSYDVTAHRVLLLLFCFIDLTTYLSITLAWPNVDRGAVSLFVMSGQTAILAGLLIVHRHRLIKEIKNGR